MKIFSNFLFLLLIDPSSFVPINNNCFEWNQRTLFSEQSFMGEVPGAGCPCKRTHCGPAAVIEKLMRSSSICEQQRTSRIQSHHRGMEHLKSTLTPLPGRTILMGGYWNISNFLWNPTTNHQCDLQKVDICRPELWDRGHEIYMSCFENQTQLLNWSQPILNITHGTQRIIPNSETNFERLLPFPNLFKVEIIALQPYQICLKSSSIVCHRRMHQTDNSQCSFYFCHTISTNTSQIVSITFKYQQTETLVTMLMMCHTLSTQQIEEYQTVKGDQMCHFLKPQTSFFLCDKQ